MNRSETAPSFVFFIMEEGRTDDGYIEDVHYEQEVFLDEVKANERAAELQAPVWESAARRHDGDERLAVRRQDAVIHRWDHELPESMKSGRSRPEPYEPKPYDQAKVYPKYTVERIRARD